MEDERIMGINHASAAARGWGYATRLCWSGDEQNITLQGIVVFDYENLRRLNESDSTKQRTGNWQAKRHIEKNQFIRREDWLFRQKSNSL